MFAAVFHRLALFVSLIPSFVGGFFAPRPAPPPRPLAPLRLELEQVLQNLPGTNFGLNGRPGNALNVVFVGSEDALRRALTSAGWTRVPRNAFASAAMGLCDVASGRWPSAYPPMNAYRLFGREQDHNFSIQTGFPFSRHHFRLWKSPFTDAEGRPVWWASADFDTAIDWRTMAHFTDPRIDLERDYIASTLRPLARRLDWVALPQVPRSGADDTGLPYRGDGRVLVALLASH